MKKISAYLSIFMSLTLTLMISFCLAFIEGARQNTVRLEAECIADIGLNSALAEYHREVLTQYNLFFIDSSYGTNYPSYYNTEANLRNYIEKNVSLRDELGILAGNSLFPGIYMDVLELEASKVVVTGVSLATDNGGYNFQKQAIQAVESDIGIGILEEVAGWIKVIEEKNLLENKVEAEIHSMEQKLSALQGKKQLEDSTWVFVDLENPVEGITSGRSKGLLSWVAGNIANISTKSIVPEQYISGRRQLQQVNQGNIVSEGNLSFYERLLFQEYLFRYAGNYLDIREGGQLDYQIEYLLFGDDSDGDNLIKTAAAICGLRETANMIYLLGDAEKREMISTISTALSAALFVPEAEPLFESLIIIAWSCLESIQDTRILLEGGGVPLLKDGASWNCSLENVLSAGIGGAGGDKQEGLHYEDYLRLLMYFCNLETVTYRFMDIMEMDIRLTEGNEHFRIDGCIDYLEIAVGIESSYGYEYELKHAKGYR